MTNLSFSGRDKVDSVAQEQLAAEIINREYEKLGQVTFPEKMIMG